MTTASTRQAGRRRRWCPLRPPSFLGTAPAGPGHGVRGPVPGGSRSSVAVRAGVVCPPGAWSRHPSCGKLRTVPSSRQREAAVDGAPSWREVVAGTARGTRSWSSTPGDAARDRTILQDKGPAAVADDLAGEIRRRGPSPAPSDVIGNNRRGAAAARPSPRYGLATARPTWCHRAGMTRASGRLLRQPDRIRQLRRSRRDAALQQHAGRRRASPSRPSRAAAISNATAAITELASGYPGTNGVIPFENGLLLRRSQTSGREVSST